MLRRAVSDDARGEARTGSVRHPGCGRCGESHAIARCKNFSTPQLLKVDRVNDDGEQTDGR
jgi:hypothetical protein